MGPNEAQGNWVSTEAQWLAVLPHSARDPVARSSCRMWEVRVTTSVPADFIYGKCTQLQLLGNRVREVELELELDELRIIREAEG
eukprot:g46166.t1